MSLCKCTNTIVTYDFIIGSESLPITKSYVTITNHAARIFGGDS